MVSPSKKSEHASKGHDTTNVVTHSRLAEGHHGTVFPQTMEGGVPNTHSAPRQPHSGTHMMSKKK